MPGISAEQLAARLAQGKPARQSCLLGQDAFLRESCREQIIEAVVDRAARPWAVQHYSAAEDELEPDCESRANDAHAGAAAGDCVYGPRGHRAAGGSKSRRCRKRSKREIRGNAARLSVIAGAFHRAGARSRKAGSAHATRQVAGGGRPVVAAELPEDPQSGCGSRRA